MQDPNKRPLSPQELFERLINGNFKESECIDEGARIREERSILISLIAEYRDQIAKRIADREQLERLIQVRARLRLQLQNIRNDRLSIDRNMADQITKFKLSPIQVREYNQWRTQLEQYRCKNQRLTARIKQLSDYALKMERYNKMLQQEKRVIQQHQILRTKSYSECSNPKIVGSDWRQRIKCMREEQQIFANQLRLRMREKEALSLRQIQQQEQDIAERNRRRLASFHHGGY